MQMQIKFFFILLCIFFSCKAENCLNNNSLITLTKNIQKESPLFLNNNFEPTRAFDLNIGSTAASVITTLITSTNQGSDGEWCDWHPTGKWLATVGLKTTGLSGTIFDFSAGNTILYHINPQNGIYHDALLRTAHWHPSGNYLAYAGRTANAIEGKVIFFDTKTGLKSDLGAAANIIHGVQVWELSWSPDGKYLVIVGDGVSSVDHVKTFSFDGYSLWQLPNATITYSPMPTGEVRACDWHPTGKYLVIGGASASSSAVDTQVFYFNKENNSMHLLPGCNKVHGARVKTTFWSNDGTFLLTGGEQAGNINYRIYSFDGKSLTLTASIYHGSSSGNPDGYSIWSADNSYIISSSGNDNFIRIYSFLNSQLKEIQSAAFNHGAGIDGLATSKDGSFIAINGFSGTGSFIVRILKFTEPIDLLQKKQKKELIKIKNMFASTSAALPQLYQTTLSTSALLDSTINYSIESLTTVTSFLVNGITGATQSSFDWHPSKNLIAVSTISTIYLYYYNDIALTQVTSIAASEPIVTTIPVWDTKWSPRGDFLLSGGWRVYINSFDGYNLTQLSSKYDHLFNGIEWDKSGNFVFCCEQRTTPTTTVNDPGRLSAYYFNGTSLTKMTSTGDLEYSNQMSVNYNNHLVAKGGSKGKVNIYAFDPLTTNTLSFIQSLNELTTSFSTVLFHPTQDILFVNTDTQIRAFSINGTFTTELTGCQVSAPGALFLNFDSTGKYLLASFSDKFIIFKFDGTTLSEVIRYSSGADVLTGAKWSADNQKIATMVDTGSTVFLRIIKPNFSTLIDSKPNLLQETSNAALSLSLGGATLMTQNSYALVNLQTLNQATSNSISGANTLNIATSNALSGLLVRTSQAANALLIPNSEAIISINALSIANSFAINSTSPLDVQNSNAVVTYQALTVNTSNAINGLLIATSNATSGLLVATSNATAGLLVATSNATNALALKALALDTIDTGPSHLHFNAASITMSYNVLLSTDHQLFVHTSGVINGNGHSITFAKGNGTFFTIDPAITTTFQNVIFKDYNDSSVLIGAGASLIFGQGCRVELNEPQTLSRTWSFAGQSLLDAHNNNISLGTGANYLSSLISSSLTIANANLLNVRDNNIRTANNNAALIFNNAQLYLNSDFTYSIGSMVINNDVILSGTSIFNYSTIMGLTIASQSKLTVNQGCTFNYAPAGNFRNLLSFTDSSATLFFNNASLVATATGPRLINGTLLVDGIMNIQSSGASTAEAIIFGNGTPTNDLLVKVMPGSELKLLSGFLNYANAN